jgi:5'-deoxynucleotidase YfbR-like HD superfamily hydrolase
MTLANIYISGGTIRYHAHPLMNFYRQTIADHQARACKLLVKMMTELKLSVPPHLLVMVLHHDMGEKWMGDLPYPFKAANPEFAAIHAQMELDKLRELGLGPTIDAMTPTDWLWLELVDKLESVLFMLYHAPHLQQTKGFRKTFDRASELAKQISLETHMETMRVITAIGDGDHD